MLWGRDERFTAQLDLSPIIDIEYFDMIFKVDKLPNLSPAAVDIIDTSCVGPGETYSPDHRFRVVHLPRISVGKLRVDSIPCCSHDSR